MLYSPTYQHHHHRAASNRAHAQQEEEGDFVQAVMKWSSKKIKDGPAPDSLVPRIDRYTNQSVYFSSFLPLIMEDARAVVAQGFEINLDLGALLPS